MPDSPDNFGPNATKPTPDVALLIRQLLGRGDYLNIEARMANFECNNDGQMMIEAATALQSNAEAVKRGERERIKRIIPQDLTQYTESSAERNLEYKRGYYDAMRRLVKQLDPETAD